MCIRLTGVHAASVAQFEGQDGLLQKLDQAKINAVVLDGSMDETLRKQAIVVFAKVPNVKVMLVSTTAAGEGVDLTAAQHVIFVNTPPYVHPRRFWLLTTLTTLTLTPTLTYPNPNTNPPPPLGPTLRCRPLRGCTAASKRPTCTCTTSVPYNHTARS